MHPPPDIHRKAPNNVLLGDKLSLYICLQYCIYMKSIVLKYGVISGLITVAIMLGSTLYEQRNGFGATPSIVAYIGVILIFIPIYLGIRNYREIEGKGFITFWKALNTGIIIIVISGVLFAISKVVIYYWITPDYPEKYSAYMMQQIKLSGKDLQDTVLVKQQMVQLKEMAKNPFILGAASFTQPLFLDIVMVLISAAILRKKSPTLELENMG